MALYLEDVDTFDQSNPLEMLKDVPVESRGDTREAIDQFAAEYVGDSREPTNMDEFRGKLVQRFPQLTTNMVERAEYSLFHANRAAKDAGTGREIKALPYPKPIKEAEGDYRPAEYLDDGTAERMKGRFEYNEKVIPDMAGRVLHEQDVIDLAGKFQGSPESAKNFGLDPKEVDFLLSLKPEEAKSTGGQVYESLRKQGSFERIRDSIVKAYKDGNPEVRSFLKYKVENAIEVDQGAANLFDEYMSKSPLYSELGWNNAAGRALLRGALSGTSRVFGLAGQGEEMHDFRGTLGGAGQAAQERTDSGWLSRKLENAAAGAVDTFVVAGAGAATGGVTGIGGIAGAITAGGLSTFDDSFQEAKKSGRSDSEAMQFAGSQAAFEVGFELLGNKLLGPGMEGVFSAEAMPAIKEATKSAILKRAGVQGLKAIGEEIPGEVITTIAQNVNSKLQGVDPGATDNLAADIGDTIAQTVLAAGVPITAKSLFQGAKDLAQAYRSAPPRSRESVKAEIEAAPDAPSRKQAAELGIEGRNSGERAEAIKALKEIVSQPVEDVAPTPRPEDAQAAPTETPIAPVAETTPELQSSTEPLPPSETITPPIESQQVEAQPAPESQPEPAAKPPESFVTSLMEQDDYIQAKAKTLVKKFPGLTADDVAQNVMLKALENWQQFDGKKGNIKQWLTGIVRNEFANAGRISAKSGEVIPAEVTSDEIVPGGKQYQNAEVAAKVIDLIPSLVANPVDRAILQAGIDAAQTTGPKEKVDWESIAKTISKGNKTRLSAKEAKTRFASVAEQFSADALGQGLVTPSEVALGVSPRSMAILNKIAPLVGDSVDNMVRWVKRNFLSGGEKNETTRALEFEKDGFIRGELSEITFRQKALERAVRAHYKIPRLKRIPSNITRLLDAGLKDPATMDRLPDEIAMPLQKMRDHADALSRLVNEYAVSDEGLQVAIEENLGMYVTRTFRKFNEPGWTKKALNDPSIMKQFADEVRESSPDATNEEIALLAEQLLRRGTIRIPDLSGATRRTQSYVNTLKERKDLSPAIRRLYGERTNVFENYVITVNNLARLVANKKFLDELRAFGLHEGFMSETGMGAKPGHVQEVNHGQIPQLKDFAGLVMEPAIADSINEMFTTNIPSKTAKVFMALSGIAKMDKTVLSFPQSHIRNFLGNIPIAIANGTWNVTDIGKSFKHTYIDDIVKSGDERIQREVKELHQLGLMEGLGAEAMQDIAKHLRVGVEDYMTGLNDVGTAKDLMRKLGTSYRKGDEFYKVLAYYDFLDVLSEANPQANPQDLKVQAAQLARALTPTYSEASKAAKWWSRVIPLGPFAMFASEILRTSGNRAKLTAQWIRSENPVLRRRGYKMLVGQAAAYLGAMSLGMASKLIVGIDDDEEEAIRQRVAPWQKNSPLIFTGKNLQTGEVTYMDGGYNDPFSIFSNPLIAAMRGQGGEAAKEVAEPFVSEDLLAGSLVSIWRNKDQNGRQVYDQGLGPSEQNEQIANYVFKQLSPGTFKQVADIASGKEGSITSTFGGVKAQVMDRNKSDLYRNRAFNRSIQDSQAAIRKAMLTESRFNPQDAEKIIQSAEATRKDTMEAWRRYIDGSVKLGQTDPYGKVVSDVGGTSDIIKTMYAGQYRPYQFSKADFRRISALPNAEARFEVLKKVLGNYAVPRD